MDVTEVGTGNKSENQTRFYRFVNSVTKTEKQNKEESEKQTVLCVQLNTCCAKTQMLDDTDNGDDKIMILIDR